MLASSTFYVRMRKARFQVTLSPCSAWLLPFLRREVFKCHYAIGIIAEPYPTIPTKIGWV